MIYKIIRCWKEIVKVFKSHGKDEVFTNTIQKGTYMAFSNFFQILNFKFYKTLIGESKCDVPFQWIFFLKYSLKCLSLSIFLSFSITKNLVFGGLLKQA